MKRIFLLLGGNKLNYGIYKKFKDKGYFVYVIDWNEHPDICGDKHYQIDVKDSFSIIKALKDDGEWEKVEFAYSSIDLAVSSVAKINREIGLNTITDYGLQYSSSKSKMTKKWEEAGLLNRYSKPFSVYCHEIEEMNTKMKLIIKPDNSASSRGITVVPQNSCPGLIKKAFEKAHKEATDEIVVVEEFVEGTEFTVDMIGDSYGNVSVYGISRKSHTKNTDKNRIAVKLHYNAIPESLQEKIAKAGIECFKALGFTSTLGHLEVILKENGTISPVEIGARSSGFIASDLVDIVSGKDYLADLIDVQRGACVKEGLHSQTDKTSMYYFYDFPENAVVECECSIIDFCDKSIISRYSDRTNISIGKKFNKIENDNSRIGYEILEGPKDVMTVEYIERAEKMMLRKMLRGSIDDI